MSPEQRPRQRSRHPAAIRRLHGAWSSDPWKGPTPRRCRAAVAPLGRDDGPSRALFGPSHPGTIAEGRVPGRQAVHLGSHPGQWARQTRFVREPSGCGGSNPRLCTTQKADFGGVDGSTDPHEAPRVIETAKPLLGWAHMPRCPVVMLHGRTTGSHLTEDASPFPMPVYSLRSAVMVAGTRLWSTQEMANSLRDSSTTGAKSSKITREPDSLRTWTPSRTRTRPGPGRDRPS